jgi:hypothetical protein
MNEWLAIAPNAQVAHGQTGCLVSLNDMADRAPRVLADGEKHRPRRRQARALHRYAAHAARLGCRRAVRGVDRTLMCGDSVHPARRWPGAHRGRCGRAGDRGGGSVQVLEPRSGMGGTIRGLSKLRRARSRSCTGPSLWATAAPP